MLNFWCFLRCWVWEEENFINFYLLCHLKQCWPRRETASLQTTSYTVDKSQTMGTISPFSAWKHDLNWLCRETLHCISDFSKTIHVLSLHLRMLSVNQMPRDDDRIEFRLLTHRPGLKSSLPISSCYDPE